MKTRTNKEQKIEITNGALALEEGTPFTREGDSFESHGIFSTHFINAQKAELLATVPASPAQVVFDEIRAKYQSIVIAQRSIRAKNADKKGMSESQTETDLFDQIIPLLGFAFHRRSFQLVGFPDYILYENEEVRAQAGQLPEEERYQLGIALMEVKMFELPLDRKSRTETPGLHYYRQIRNYLTDKPSSPINWGILTNGKEWRLYHRNDDVTAYFSMNLDRALGDLESFRLFLALFGKTAFSKGDSGKRKLDELWSDSLAKRQDLEERLRDRVFKLAGIIANGFYDPRLNNHITENDLDELYTNSLVLLYRLLFILYAESRELLPVKDQGTGARKAYRELYSLRKYQETLPSTRLPRGYDVHTTEWSHLVDLFETIDGSYKARSDDLGIPRYNGGLFDVDNYWKISTHSLKGWKLGNYTVSQLLKGLIYVPTPSGPEDTISVDFQETIDYKNLSVQQLGSIYEGLLEFKPEVVNGRIRLKEIKQQPRAKSERKVSGSYYTPEWVVDYIVEETLNPLITQIEESPEVIAGKENSFADAVLKIKVLDPSMGSGHFLVGATEYLGDKIAEHNTSLPIDPKHPDDIKANRAYWRRRVVESCIFGVDLNFLAVELSKLSLWLTCITPSNPLNFLDHHLRHGNSLVGSSPKLFGIIDKIKESQRAGNLFIASGVQTALNEAIASLNLILSIPSDDYDEVKIKEKIYRDEVRSKLGKFENIAHLRTASDLGYEIDQVKYKELCEKLIDGAILPDDVSNLHETNHFFNFELAFPEVFFQQSGEEGFDVVIGNPPYVRQESLGNIKNFLEARFYTPTGTTDIYVPFIEHAFNLLREGGRFGYIVSNKWMRAAYGEKLRSFLLKRQIEKIIDFGEAKVFNEPVVMPMIIIASNKPPVNEPVFASIPALPVKTDDVTAKMITEMVNESAISLSSGAMALAGFTLVKRDLSDVFQKMKEAGKPL